MSYKYQTYGGLKPTPPLESASVGNLSTQGNSMHANHQKSSITHDKRSINGSQISSEGDLDEKGIEFLCY